MKKRILIAILAMLFANGIAAAAVIITPESFTAISQQIQNDITIQQATTDGNVQVRDLATTNIRSITQSFTWNTLESLSGVGLKLDSTQTFTGGSQAYELRIFQIAAIFNGSAVSSTLQTYQFNLDSSVVVPSNYLYFSFSDSLTLNNGGTYMFQLAPVAQNTTNILYLCRTTTDTYLGGSNAQLSTNTSPTTVSSIGTDMTFFLTSVPEPGTWSLFVLSGALALILSSRRRVGSI